MLCSVGKSMRLFFALVTCTVVLSACSSSAPESIAFSDTSAPEETSSEDSPATTTQLFDEGDLDLVAFQARWVCELQRRTFPELSGIEEALTETLIGAGLDRGAYDVFLIDLSESQALRDEVLAQYKETCRA